MQRLAAGRKDLIDAALMNSAPREGSVCRPMKVGKEEIIGCLTALETWLNLDEKKLYSEWNGRVERIRKLVDTVPGVKTDIYIPDDGNRFPTLKVSWDQAAWGFTISTACRSCARTIPSSKCSARTIPAWCRRFAKAIRIRTGKNTRKPIISNWFP